jgi:hypothetical protein
VSLITKTKLGLSACRVAIRVPTYVEQRPDRLDDYHVTDYFVHVVDKDTTNWMDFNAMLAKEIVHGKDQALKVTFFNKTKDETVPIDSNSALLEAFHVYWESRRLPLTIEVVDTGPRLVQSMPDKEERKKVDIGFKLLPPICKRATGRPRKRTLVGVIEGGSSSKSKRRCKRCGGFGHLQKTCNETFVDPDAPPPASPKKRRTYKPKVVEIIETTDDPSKSKKRKASSKGKQLKKKKATPAEPTLPKQAMQYVITPYIS